MEIASAFRFTVHVPGLDFLTHFVASLNYSLTDNILDLSLYDVDEVFDWIKKTCFSDYDLPVVYVKNYDGKGNVLNTLEFLNLSLINHENRLDYSTPIKQFSEMSTTEMSMHRIAFAFETVNRIPATTEPSQKSS